MSRSRRAAGVVAALAITGVGVRGSADAAEPAPKGCKLAQVAELPVRFEHNRPLIEAEMNGRKTWLLADTGASVTSLFGGSLKGQKLALSSAAGAIVYGVGGRADAQAVQLNSLKLGDYDVPRPPLMLLLSGVGSADDPEAGVLGRDLLSNYEVELDFKNSKIRLLRADNCKTTDLAYWAKTYSLAGLRRSAGEGYYTDVVLNGRRVSALIDSGSVVSLVTARAAALAGVTPQAATATNVAHGIGARAIPTYTAKFTKLEIGDESVSNVKLQVGDFFNGTESVRLGSRIARRPEDLADVILGADFLRAHRVLLSKSQSRLYFTYNGGPIFQVISSDAPAAGSGAVTDKTSS